MKQSYTVPVKLSDELIRMGELATRPYAILAVDDDFVHPRAVDGRPEPIFRTAGVDAAAIAVQIRRLICQ